MKWKYIKILWKLYKLKQYVSYTSLKQNNTRFISSITEALKVLGVFNNSDSMPQQVSITAFNIDNEIVQKFFSVSKTVFLIFLWI